MGASENLEVVTLEEGLPSPAVSRGSGFRGGVTPILLFTSSVALGKLPSLKVPFAPP